MPLCSYGQETMRTKPPLLRFAQYHIYSHACSIFSVAELVWIPRVIRAHICCMSLNVSILYLALSLIIIHSLQSMYSELYFGTVFQQIPLIDTSRPVLARYDGS
jgi:hypothetical protein